MADRLVPLEMARITALSEKHLDAARALHNDFVGARKRFCGICSYGCCPDSAQEFAGPYRRSTELFALSAVAMDGEDGEVIGFVRMSEHGIVRDALSECLHTVAEDEVYIEEICVSAKARGRGVGTSLLTWCESTAKARGAKVLSLGVVNGNPAMRLYERVGFVKEPSSCSTGPAVCILFGVPHGQCGATHMMKTLS